MSGIKPIDGYPVEIFYKDDKTGRYNISSEFDSILECVGDNPFVVISLNGVERSGKSFMLNYIMQFLMWCKEYFKTDDLKTFISREQPNPLLWMGISKPNGFESKGGDKTVTIGILMWSKPIFVTFKKDDMMRKVGILFMDVQGSYSNNFDANESAILFSFSAQLSDIFIWNVKHDIRDDTELQFMQVYFEYLPKDDDFEKFKNIIFLVRDFEWAESEVSNYYYGYYDDNIKPKRAKRNYKIDKLNPSKKLTRDHKNYSYRKAIIDNYIGVSCFIMSFPPDVIKLGKFDWNMQKLYQDSSDQKFPNLINEFLKKIFTEPIFGPKEIGKREITGRLFKDYVPKWKKYYESKLPSLSSLLIANVETQLTHLYTESKEIYSKEMKKLFTFSKKVTFKILRNTHKKLKKKALSNFDEAKKFGPKKEHGKFREKLKEKIRKLHEKYHEVIEKWQKQYEIADTFISLIPVFGPISLFSIGIYQIIHGNNERAKSCFINGAIGISLDLTGLTVGVVGGALVFHLAQIPVVAGGKLLSRIYTSYSKYRESKKKKSD